MYTVTLKNFNRRFKGDESFTIETVHVHDWAIDEWKAIDDFHCKTLSCIKEDA
jgi:hypothetical protein